MRAIKPIQLTPRKFEDLSPLEYSLFTCPLPQWPSKECLIVEFTGECGAGHQSNGDAAFMTAIVKAALEAWEASALILDLRKLKYEWGDQMTRVLAACGSFDLGRLQLMSAFGEELAVADVTKIPKAYLAFPTACVVSGLNRTGLISLVKQEMGMNPDEILFETTDAALIAVESKLLRVFKSSCPS